MAPYNDYVTALEAAVDYWRKKHDRAQERARYWAKMYDELTAIKNNELSDKWQPCGDETCHLCTEHELDDD